MSDDFEPLNTTPCERPPRKPPAPLENPPAATYEAWSQEKPDLPWEITKEQYSGHVEEYRHPGEFVPDLVSLVMPIKTMLDVGGGKGVVAEPWFKAQGVAITILDKWWGYKDREKPANLVLGDALEALEIFGEKSFDYVQATEIIEHMPKADGRRLIEVLKQVTRKALLLSTPYAYLEQPAQDGNPYQLHVCGWMPQEFEAMGLAIYFNASQMFGGWLHPDAEAELSRKQ